jgi:hypothetical protein
MKRQVDARWNDAPRVLALIPPQRVFALFVFLLLITGNYIVRLLADVQWHNVHTKFRGNRTND